jgi:O-antigen ligase
MWAFALGGVALAALAVTQQVTHAYSSDFGGFANALPYLDTYRSAGPLSANYFGQMLVISIVLLLTVTWGRAEVGDRPFLRVAGGLGALCCVGAVVFTLSRGALLALAVALVTAGILQRWRWLPVAAVAVVVVGLVVLPSQFKERLAALSTPTSTNAVDVSTRNRLGENLAAVQMFAHHPLVGVGPGNFDGHYLEYSQYIGLDPRAVPRQPHDLYLEVLSERGLLGAAAFGALLGFALVGAFRARRHPDAELALLAEGIFVAFVALLVTGLFLHAAYPRYLWITVGLALAARRAALAR